MNDPHQVAQSTEDARANRRHKKRNPKMKMTGKGMKRFGAPKKPPAVS